MHRCKGLTLMELVVGIAILTITVAVAIPGLARLYEDQMTKSLRHQFLRTIKYTRSQAVGKAMPVSLCPASDDAICRQTWSDNLMVFTDANGDGRLNDADELLRLVPLEPRGEIDWRSFRGVDYLQFTATGITPALNGTISYCPYDRAHKGFAIAVARTGRARIKVADGCPR